MALAWRIVKQKRAATAFDGQGAAENGGRWNSLQVPIIYTSGTKSLAALEILVHLNPRLPFVYAAFRLKFDDALMEKRPRHRLPADWTIEPPPSSIQTIGDEWVRKARSAVLDVPSVIIPEESNYLLNPAHPDFKKISIGKPEKFSFDPRLLVGRATRE
jgi:RES domain-containing protein